MEQGRLGVAIHGAGWVGRAHAASWRRNPHCRIVSVGSRRRESAEQMVHELDLGCPVHDRFEDILQDPRVDVVNISGPNHVHAEQGIAAAEAGKHILVEKPMCISMAENRALRDAVARNGVKSVVSFVLRWNPLVQNLKSLCARGAIGELFYVEVNYWHGIGPWYSGWEWAHSLASGRSTMLLVGCHAIDAIRYLSGDQIVEVSAVSNNKLGLYEFDANVAAVLKFAGGAIGMTSALCDAQMPYQFNIDLAGTQGTIRDTRVWSKPLFPGQTGWNTMQTITPDSGDVKHHPFDGQIDDFVEAVRSGHDSHCNVADAYVTHEVAMAIDRSLAEGGAPVKLPLPD